MDRFPRKPSSAVVALTLCFMLCFANFASPTSQPAPASTRMQRFAGIWHAEFEGRTFLTLKLENALDGLIGSISHCDFQVDKNGELIGAVQHDGGDPISDARIEKGILRLTAKDVESQDTIHFEMKLIGADQAELRILTPSGIAAPKPWKLERSNAH